MEKQELELKYCLYARKSSESDERQAMSIESQLKEMRALADNKGLNIVEEKEESRSAKDSGNRPVYNEMLQGIEAKNTMPYSPGLRTGSAEMLAILARLSICQAPHIINN